METLPETAADFLYSSEMGGIVREIAGKHSLHIDQTGLLEAEAGQLILGLTEPQDFAPYIAESLKISAEKAATIARDINEKVMSKIRASMGQPSSAGAAAPTSALSKPQTAPVPESGATYSVMMPSSSTLPPTPPTPTPASAPVPPATPPPAPKPSVAPNLLAADAILSEKRVVAPVVAPKPATPASPVIAPATPAASPVPQVDPTQPQNYKADPYREPVE